MTAHRAAAHRLLDALLGRVVPGRRYVPWIHFLLSVLWIAAIHLFLAFAPVGTLSEAVRTDWARVRPPYDVLGVIPEPDETREMIYFAISGGVAVGLAQFVLQFTAGLATAGRRATFSLLAATTWQACLGGIVIVPCVAWLVHVAALITPIDLGAFKLIALPHVYLLVMGTLLMRGATRKRRRPVRWRPLCPECGYDIFRSAEPRCAECGAAFPTPSRAYRRWAIPRLPWDCLRRAGLVRDYLVTLWRVVVCPCSAARRLVIPDRFGRASRWAVGHLLIALGLLMCMRFLNPLIWLGLYVTGTADERAGMIADREGEPLLTLNEFGWPLLANAIALGLIPAIGAGLAWLIPMRHPAARAAGIKWSLYAAAVPLVVVLASVAGYVAVLFAYGRIVGGSLVGEAPWPHLPVLAAAFIGYGLWWSIGMNAHPYQRRGGLWFVGYATAFTAACLLLYYVILPPWVLVTLL